MITDAILTFFINIYHFFISLLSPITNTVNIVVDGLTAFKNFIIPVFSSLMLYQDFWFLTYTGLFSAIVR